MGKQGYRPAGRLKWTEVKDGRYVDGLLFDVKREEWLAARDAWRARRAERVPGHRKEREAAARSSATRPGNGRRNP